MAVTKLFDGLLLDSINTTAAGLTAVSDIVSMAGFNTLSLQAVLSELPTSPDTVDIQLQGSTDKTSWMWFDGSDWVADKPTTEATIFIQFNASKDLVEANAIAPTSFPMAYLRLYVEVNVGVVGSLTCLANTLNT